MQTTMSILGKFRTIAAAVMVLMLVVSQIGMSHAMAAMPDQGPSNAGSHSANTHSASYSANQPDDIHVSAKVAKAASDHIGEIPAVGAIDFDHSEQGHECAAVCVSAMMPDNAMLSDRLAKDAKFNQEHTFGLSNALAGLKRPPRT